MEWAGPIGRAQPRKGCRVAGSRQKAFAASYQCYLGKSGHKTVQNNRALEAAFDRARLDDVSSQNLSKTFATRLLSRCAAITDVQHLLGHALVKTTERAYAALVRNEHFMRKIDLLDEPKKAERKVLK